MEKIKTIFLALTLSGVVLVSVGMATLFWIYAFVDAISGK